MESLQFKALHFSVNGLKLNTTTHRRHNMQFTFKKTIGLTEFSITETAENEKELFKKASFFESLPSVGPNGEVDLTLTYRTTKDGHEYFSIVSKLAGKEFKIGQNLKGGTLFAKGWEDAYVSENSEGSTGSNVGLGNSIGAQSSLGAVNAELKASPPAPTQEGTKVANDVLGKYGL